MDEVGPIPTTYVTASIVCARLFSYLEMAVISNFELAFKNQTSEAGLLLRYLDSVGGSRPATPLICHIGQCQLDFLFPYETSQSLLNMLEILVALNSPDHLILKFK